MRLLCDRILADQAAPVAINVSNAETRRAMAEVDNMVKARNARFASMGEMIAEREEVGG